MYKSQFSWPWACSSWRAQECRWDPGQTSSRSQRFERARSFPSWRLNTKRKTYRRNVENSFSLAAVSWHHRHYLTYSKLSSSWKHTHTWLPVENVKPEDGSDDESNDGGDPVHQEHGGHAQQGAEQGQPGVVPLEGRPPAGRLGDARVEHGEVDQGIGGHEKIGEQGWDNV